MIQLVCDACKSDIKDGQEKIKLELGKMWGLRDADLCAPCFKKLTADWGLVRSADAEVKRLVRNANSPVSKEMIPMDDLTARLRNILINEGITTFDELAERSEVEFRILGNCGRKTLNELRGLLTERGMNFNRDYRSFDLKGRG